MTYFIYVVGTMHRKLFAFTRLQVEKYNLILSTGGFEGIPLEAKERALSRKESAPYEIPLIGFVLLSI